MEAITCSMNKTELNPRRETLLAGVYVLYHAGRPVYIGQSYKVYDRIYAHLVNQTVAFDSWRVLPIADDALRQFTETALIWALQPEGNVLSALKTAALTYQSTQRVRGAPQGEESMTIQDMQQIIAQKTGDNSLIGDAQSVRPELPRER